MTEKSKPEIVFAPGCFDHFDGTQEELDALMEEIKTAFANEDFMANSRVVNLDTLAQDDPELYQHLTAISDTGRTLQ